MYTKSSFTFESLSYNTTQFMLIHFVGILLFANILGRIKKKMLLLSVWMWMYVQMLGDIEIVM